MTDLGGQNPDAGIDDAGRVVTDGGGPADGGNTTAPQRPSLTGVELETQVVYTGGTTVRASPYGVSFEIPAGFSGQLDGDYLVLTSNTGLMAISAGRAGDAETQAFLSQTMDFDGITANPLETPQKNGDVWSVPVFFNDGQTALDGLVSVRVGPFGISVLAGTAPRAIDATGTQLLNSVVFVEPTLPEPGVSQGDWISVLADTTIQYSFSGSDYFEEFRYRL